MRMIRYAPDLGSELWEHKTQILFESMDDLKHCVAKQATRFCSYIGYQKTFNPDDIQTDPCEDKTTMGLKNCHHIIINGCIVGYCGE